MAGRGRGRVLRRRQRRRVEGDPPSSSSSSSSDEGNQRIVPERVHARVAFAPNTNQDPMLKTLMEEDKRIRKRLRATGRVHGDELRRFRVPGYLAEEDAEVQPVYAGICTLVNKTVAWRRRYFCLAIDLTAKQLLTNKDAKDTLLRIEECLQEIEVHQERVVEMQGREYDMPDVFARDLKLIN